MNDFPTRQEAILFLYRSGCPEGVVKHSIFVSKIALEIAEACKRNGVNVDTRIVQAGSILHDVGRCVTHDVRHGVIGASLAKAAGFPEAIVQMIENHVGAGITEDEAVQLGLPAKNYMPRTLEEKIVVYADKLVRKERRLTVKEATESLSRDLGSKNPAISRFKQLHEELSRLIEVDCRGASSP